MAGGEDRKGEGEGNLGDIAGSIQKSIQSHQCAGITATRVVKFLGLVLRYNSWLKSTLQHSQIFPAEKLTAELGREELNTGPFPGNYLLTSRRNCWGLYAEQQTVNPPACFNTPDLASTDRFLPGA